MGQPASSCLLLTGESWGQDKGHHLPEGWVSAAWESWGRRRWVPLPGRASQVSSCLQVLPQTQEKEKRLMGSKVMELMGIR